MWSDVRLLTHLSESDVEQAALEWLEGLGLAEGPRADIAAGRTAVGAGVG